MPLIEKGRYPPDFARDRLKLSRYNFGQIKNRFMEKWPQISNHMDLRYALERIVIYRNSFSHAHVQPHIKYLLYTPDRKNLNAMLIYCKCENCEKYYKDCQCEGVEPRTFTHPCLDQKFRNQLFSDMKTVYQGCILMAAKDLGLDFGIQIRF